MTMSEMSHVSVTTKDGVATLVLHNPPQNRIGTTMVDEFDAALDEIAAGSAGAARAVVLRAEGPDFSFGGDIEPWPGWDRREMRALELKQVVRVRALYLHHHRPFLFYSNYYPA